MIIDLNTQHNETIKQILDQCSLPSADIDQADWFSILGWRDGSDIVGIGGIERCEECMLLRSIAVKPSHRGTGLALPLVEELHNRARLDGYEKCYLLTLDADHYFQEKFNYNKIERSSAPQAIARSRQFSGICPGSATLMEKTFTN